MSQRVRDQFDLTGRVAVITGGIGLLGRKHAEAIAESGGRPVLVDLDEAKSRGGRGRDRPAIRHTIARPGGRHHATRRRRADARPRSLRPSGVSTS